MGKLFRSCGAIVALVVSSCSSNPGGTGSGDPCDQTPTLTCSDTDTCDEVYTAQAAHDFMVQCDDLHLAESTSHCALMQCCYDVNGLNGHPSLHCVSTSIDPHYQTYCESNGGTYCAR